MSDLEVKVMDLEKFYVSFLVTVFRGKVQFRRAMLSVLA